MNTRASEVVNLKKVSLSYAEIGRRLGISRERARQIAGGKPSPRKASGVMLTTSQVAEFLGVHPNTVRHWSEKGILKTYRIGPRSDRRFRREDMDSFINGGGKCPIGLDKIHCQNCYFWRDGKCSYDEIIQEIEDRETMERMLNEGKEKS